MRLLVAMMMVAGATALFEWIHPETWRRETREAVESAGQQAAQGAEDAAEKVKEQGQAVQDAVHEGYGKAKQSVKEAARGARNAANEYIFDPLKRMFNPMQFGTSDDEPEWLYHALIATSPPKHFFRTFPDEYILFVDCPGIPPTAIKVSISGSRTIKIQGSHEACIEERGHGGRGEGRLCVERHVDREYKYPEDVNPEGVECAIKDGVLAMRFPRIQPVGRAVPVRQVKTSF